MNYPTSRAPFSMPRSMGGTQPTLDSDPLTVFFGTLAEDAADIATFGIYQPDIIKESTEAAYPTAATIGSITGQVTGFLASMWATQGISSAAFAGLAGVSKWARIAQGSMRAAEAVSQMTPAAGVANNLFRGGVSAIKTAHIFGLQNAARETVRQFKEQDPSLTDAAEKYALGALEGGIYGMAQGAFKFTHPIMQAMAGGSSFAVAEAVTMAHEGEDINLEDLSKTFLMGATLSLIASRGWEERKFQHNAAVRKQLEDMDKVLDLPAVKKLFLSSAKGYTTPKEYKKLEQVLLKSEKPFAKKVFTAVGDKETLEITRGQQKLIKEAQRAADIPDDLYRNMIKDVTKGKVSSKDLTRGEAKLVYDEIIHYGNQEFAKAVIPEAGKLKDPGILSAFTPIDRVLQKMGATDLVADITRAKQYMDVFNTKVSAAARANLEIFAADMPRQPIKGKIGAFMKNEPNAAKRTMMEILEIDDIAKYEARLAQLTPRQADAVRDMRKITDYFFNRTNEALEAMGMDKIPYRSGYMHHIVQMGERYDYRSIRDLTSWGKKPELMQTGKNVTTIERDVKANAPYLKDPVRAIETMARFDLKTIFLHNPAKAFKAKAEMLYKSGLLSEEQAKYLYDYIDFSILNVPTPATKRANDQLYKLITGGKHGEWLEAGLNKFNRTMSKRPADDFSRIWGTAATRSMMLFRPALAFRNLTGQFLFPWGLSDTPTIARAMGPMPKELKKRLETSSVWLISKQDPGFEQGLVGQMEKAGGQMFQAGHMKVAEFAAKTGWWQAVKHFNENPLMKNGKVNPKYWGTDTGAKMREAARKSGNKNWREVMDDIEIDRALKNAENMIADTEFLYHATGMPSVYRNPIGRAAFKFMSYPMNYALKYVPRMVKQSVGIGNGNVPWDMSGKLKYSTSERLGLLHHFIGTSAIFVAADQLLGLNYFDSLGIYYSPSEAKQGRGMFGKGIELGAYEFRPSILPQAIMSVKDMLSPEPYIRKRAIRQLSSTIPLMASGTVAPGGLFVKDVGRAIRERDASVIVTRRPVKKQQAAPKNIFTVNRRKNIFTMPEM